MKIKLSGKLSSVQLQRIANRVRALKPDLCIRHSGKGLQFSGCAQALSVDLSISQEMGCLMNVSYDYDHDSERSCFPSQLRNELTARELDDSATDEARRLTLEFAQGVDLDVYDKNVDSGRQIHLHTEVLGEGEELVNRIVALAERMT
jgi:hypothetical protein